ncbi:MAG: NADH-quinone oxidoreductase subunit C [Actinobacteria bacterium]|nr:NADH-quinone oxidoreductase subunit C [Actinomycetota bacterium]
MSDAPADATEDEVATEEAPAPEPELLHGAPVTRANGQRVAHVERGSLVAVARALRDEGWLMCLDVTAVDYLTNPTRVLPDGIDPERFEVVVTLISHADRERLRLRVQVPEADPTVPSLFEVHPGTEAMEREVFDLFGITFTDHPDLTRILMPEDWVGHPLRKDFAVGSIPVQFKAPSRG